MKRDHHPNQSSKVPLVAIVDHMRLHHHQISRDTLYLKISCGETTSRRNGPPIHNWWIDIVETNSSFPTPPAKLSIREITDRTPSRIAPCKTYTNQSAAQPWNWAILYSQHPTCPQPSEHQNVDREGARAMGREFSLKIIFLMKKTF